MYFHDEDNGFYDCDLELLDSEQQRAALLELSEEIANIEAEIQHLKEAKSETYDSVPGYATHAFNNETLRKPDGLMALSSPKHRDNKRRRSAKPSTNPHNNKKRRTAPAKRLPKVTTTTTNMSYMSKEQLLNAITDELPPRFLEGVIRIVKPTFDPTTALDEDLEFDINVLDDEVLYRLMQYVHGALAAPHPPPKKVTRKKQQRPRITKPVKRETSKQRHKKEASEVFREIFKTEEIIKVTKCDSEEEEDEVVDIVGF